MIPGPGWYKDPYFLKHERYWNNGWTDQVRSRRRGAGGARWTTVKPTLARGAAVANSGAPLGTEAAAAPAGMAAPPSGGEPHTAVHPIFIAPEAAPEIPEGGEPPTAPTSVVHDDDTLAVPAVPAVAAVRRAAVAAVRRYDDTATVRAISAEPRYGDTATVPAYSAEPDTLSQPVFSGTDSERPRTVGASVAPPGGSSSNGLAASPPPPVPWDAGGASAEEAAAVRARARHRRIGFVAAAVVLVALGVVASVLATGGSPSRGASDPGQQGGGTANSGTANSGTVNSGTANSAANNGTANGAANGGGTSLAASAASPSAAQTMTTVATRSLQKNAVVASVTLTPAASSTQSTTHAIAGSGEFSLASGLGALSVTESGAKTQDQKFAFQGHTLYIYVTNSPVAGKSWVVASTNDVPSLGPGSSLSSFMEEMGNPGMLVQQLTGTSNSVASLGTATVGGTSVQRYQVSFSSSPTASSAAGFGTNTTEEVDVGADGLVKRIVIPVAVYGQGVEANIVVTYSRYGKQISVDTPAFSQLISLSQYLTGPT